MYETLPYLILKCGIICTILSKCAIIYNIIPINLLRYYMQ